MSLLGCGELLADRAGILQSGERACGEPSARGGDMPGLRAGYPAITPLLLGALGIEPVHLACPSLVDEFRHGSYRR